MLIPVGEGRLTDVFPVAGMTPLEQAPEADRRKREKKMTKSELELREQALVLCDEGLSSAEVAKRLGIDAKSIGPWKAHRTRGSYGTSTTGPVNGGTAERIEAAEQTTFGMERDLQRALRANIAQLESGLRILDGGKERQTAAGNIDITAEDSTGTTVVIELKAGEAQPDALAQLMSYMGALKERPVRGILIAHDFHPRLIHAVEVASNVALRRYSHKFTFDGLTATEQ